MMTITSISILLLVIIFLLFKIYNLNKENIVKEIKKDSFILDKPVNSNPKYLDIDTNHILLTDTLYSMSTEGWKMELKREDDIYIETYNLTFLNSSGTIKSDCKIRLYDDDINNIHLSWFNIRKMINSLQHSHIVTFDDSDHKSKWIIINYMWKYILDYHMGIRNTNIQHYLSCKDVISKELKSLNRDRKIDDILGF